VDSRQAPCTVGGSQDTSRLPPTNETRHHIEGVLEMRKLLRTFIRWALRDEDSDRPKLGLVTSPDHETRAKVRLGVIHASNGRLLEVSTYKPNPHGPDWATELFIVPDDQTLAQSITTILTLKSID